MMLSIIITHHKTPELLDLCLNSIKETIGNIKHEIVIVDSEFQEKTKEIISDKYPEVKFLPFKKNIGYSKIVNAGLKKVKGDYVLILNADIIVLNGAIPQMLKFLKENSKVGMVAPQLLDFYGQYSNFMF